MGAGSMRMGRRGRKGKLQAKIVVAAGALAAAGGVFLVRARPWRGTEVAELPTPMALSLPAGAPRGAPPPQPGLPGPAIPQESSPVPSTLRAALERAVGDARDPFELLDLRRLAVEWSATPEGARAAELLAKERQRCEARAAQAAADAPEALRALTRAWLATTDAAERRAMRQKLMELSSAVFFVSSGKTSVTEYKAQPGDSLARIAKQASTDWRFIKRLNGLKAETVRVGQRFRVPTGAIRVVVFKRDFECALIWDGRFLHCWDVATGKDGCTPETEFTIGNKVVEPDWYSPEGKVYKFGHPENVLGTRWLAFENTADHQGFGIHGTKFPESIGTEASLGCVRLRNEEVEVLFDLVPTGSKVRIQK